VKTKPIKVNWEEFESAFDSGTEELVYYLDRITGHLVMEGEGEENEYEENGTAAAPPPDDLTRLAIHPITTARKINWIRSFLVDVTDLDPEFKGALTEALEAENAVGALTEVLHQNAEGSDRWYHYRAGRLHKLIEKWLEDNGVAVANPPPWKGSGDGQPS
jgi:hypothetical protein